MKLSLCLAVYNEINFIHYPLDSAYDFVDEVIIVDGGSTDGTIEKAKSYGSKVKIISTDNLPMFHINKQKALEAATGDWVIQLDADEALSDNLKKEITEIIRNNKEHGAHDKLLVAYWLPRKNWFLTRFLTKGGIYPDYTIRMYKRGVAHFPCKSVHENVEIKGEVGYLKNDLLHYADPDFARYLYRWVRYAKMDVAFILERKEKLNWFSYFIWKPLTWFFLTYFRHRGYVDGFPGFVFALFSALRNWIIYIFVWQERHKK
ncbi:glycosyltransferase family 2 protein [Candidatus Roizmanbacteria bacterium]|nr:glycosyltransferase family 2 protein [Candidatus Roizmanbacteria bacterium]